ncbi:RNA polymerase sigma factor [Salsipaludibacter albus]|uniref:RNA polymerase sigma factor n=1 Tax=Salsipaludibacter albus TaxID=2849650 RepID=UPI001EE4B3D2|nr:sigma-70 family RNA polymerase sigma factor [Salsipaludibacter albus]
MADDRDTDAEHDPEERRVAHALVAGEPDALADAFARWGDMIHALCTRWADVDAADDLTQQVFIAAWRSRANFDPSRGVLPAWLVGIARNTTNRSFRGAREVPTDPADAGHDLPVEDHADALADEVLVAHALAELPEAHRLSLELSYWEGLTQAEVATRLDLPLGTVKSHQRRGLQRLRTLLEVSHDQR